MLNPVLLEGLDKWVLNNSNGIDWNIETQRECTIGLHGVLVNKSWFLLGLDCSQNKKGLFSKAGCVMQFFRWCFIKAAFWQATEWGRISMSESDEKIGFSSDKCWKHTHLVIMEPILQSSVLLQWAACSFICISGPLKIKQRWKHNFLARLH